MPRNPDFRRVTALRPQPRIRDVNAQQELLRNLAKPSPTIGIQYAASPVIPSPVAGGMNLSSARTEGFPARITAGSNPYSWVRLVEDDSPVGVLIDDPSTLSGSSSAYALRGSTNVPVNAKVWLRLSDDQQFWWFDETDAGRFGGDLIVGGDLTVGDDLNVTGDLTVTGTFPQAFSGAQVFRASQNITNNTATAVAFSDGGSEKIDEGGYFTSANNTRLTAPVTGYYRVYGSAALAPQSALANATDPFYMALFFGFNGTPGGLAIADLKLVAQNAGVVGASINVSNIILLSSGDYMELYAKTVHETGGAATNGNVSGAWFEIFYLGS